MAGHTKTPSNYEHSMFGFGQFCRNYGCFVWRRKPNKKRLSSSKRKSIMERRPTNSFDSFEETFKDICKDRTAPKDINNVLRSNKSSEVHNNNDIPNSPVHNPRTSSHASLSKISSLSKITHRTNRIPTPTKTRSLNRQSGPLTNSTERLEPKNRGRSGPLFTTSRERSGSMAYSGPLLRTTMESPNIMYSKSNGLVQLLAIEESLECSLEELCFGCVKKITVARAVIASNGQIVEEEETLSIKVRPGWANGTMITFEGTKDEEKDTHSCDIVFVIKEETHALYRREGDDLELAVRIPLLQALTGCDLSIPLLGGDKLNLTIDDIIMPGYEKVIEGQGMPKSKEHGHRGNLKIKFLVDFPKELTENQRSDIATILQDSC